MSQLEKIADDIWIAEGEIVDFYGFPYSTRCVIVRLENADLWVWSPIALSLELKDEIAKIGVPTHLVSPNKIRHLYLQDWKEAYPTALLWGPETTINKRTDLNFQAPLADVPPNEWHAEIDHAWFRGSKFLDEIIFFHKKSGTAILADMSENFTEEFLQENWSGWKRWIARFWGIVEGKGYAPLELRLTAFDKSSIRKSRDKILSWEPQRVIMAHGKWQNQNGKKFLEKSFEWIG